MKQGFISKYFPPPKFLKPPHIGMSFSDTNIKAIGFDHPARKPHLKSVVVSVAKGAIVDGHIIDAEDVSKNLRDVRKNFDSPFVFFTVPDELAYVFSVSVPVGSYGNATESVAFTIEENVPLSLADAVFDFMPVELAHSDAEHKASVVVAACVRKEVETFVQVLRQSGFEPVGCIHESQAIANAAIHKDFSETSCIVHARKNRVGIYLVKREVVHFSTLKSISGDDFGSQFLDEYEKFIEYCVKYDTNQKGPIRSVSVYGEFAYAKRAVETILDSSRFTKNVKLGNVWTNVFSIEEDMPSINYEDSLNLAGPIGAVLSSTV